MPPMRASYCSGALGSSAPWPCLLNSTSAMLRMGRGMRRSFSSDRHPHRGAQAAERAVAQADVAAMRARDVARDGETEPGAALVLVARIVEPQERLEHL